MLLSKYGQRMHEMLRDTTRPSHAVIENAISTICILCDVPSPKAFFWMESDVQAKAFIDKNATVSVGSVADAWEKWKTTGTRPPFYNEWGRYSAYVLAAMAQNPKGFGATYTAAMREALLVLAGCSSWFLFEGGAVIIEQPKAIEILPNGIISELEYSDGVKYKLENAKFVGTKHADEFFCDHNKHLLIYECSEPREAAAIPDEGLGLCITDNVSGYLTVFTAEDAKKFLCNWNPAYDEDRKVKRQGRNSMQSIAAMSKLTVSGVLQRSDNYIGKIAIVQGKME